MARRGRSSSGSPARRADGGPGGLRTQPAYGLFSQRVARVGRDTLGLPSLFRRNGDQDQIPEDEADVSHLVPPQGRAVPRALLYSSTRRCASRVGILILSGVRRREEITGGDNVNQPRFEVTPIGRVESPLTDPESAPNQGDEGAPEAWLAFEPAVLDALDGIREGDE